MKRQSAYTIHRAAKTFGCSVDELKDAIADGALPTSPLCGIQVIETDDLEYWLTYGPVEADLDMTITLLSASAITGLNPKTLMLEVIQNRLKAKTRNRHWTRWLISFRDLKEWRDDAKTRGLKVL